MSQYVTITHERIFGEQWGTELTGDRTKKKAVRDNKRARVPDVLLPACIS
jgi:hypothetical protein